MIVFISSPTYRITTITTIITTENSPKEHTPPQPRIPVSFLCPKRDKGYIHRPVKEYGHTRTAIRGVEYMADTNGKDIVYIGSKPQMSYVLAVITQFNEGHASEVILKARGKAISRTVDVAEIVKNKFMPSVRIEDIRTSTESVTRDDGSFSNVSAIEITLRK